MVDVYDEVNMKDHVFLIVGYVIPIFDTYKSVLIICFLCFLLIKKGELIFK